MAIKRICRKDGRDGRKEAKNETCNGLRTVTTTQRAEG